MVFSFCGRCCMLLVNWVIFKVCQQVWLLCLWFMVRLVCMLLLNSVGCWRIIVICLCMQFRLIFFRGILLQWMLLCCVLQRLSSSCISVFLLLLLVLIRVIFLLVLMFRFNCFRILFLLQVKFSLCISMLMVVWLVNGLCSGGQCGLLVCVSNLLICCNVLLVVQQVYCRLSSCLIGLIMNQRQLNIVSIWLIDRFESSMVSIVVVWNMLMLNWNSRLLVCLVVLFFYCEVIVQLWIFWVWWLRWLRKQFW